MAGNNSDHLQGSMYDKLFRENMQENLPGIIEHVLNLELITIEELQDDVQYTKERKTDLLKKVADQEGNIYVLHVEYQIDNYKHMQYRMAEYSIMLQRKHNLPVKQFVIYIGPGKPVMPTTIESQDLQFRYSLTALSSVDHRLFLRSDKIEEKMLAILGNMDHQDSMLVLEQVLLEIKQVSTDELSTDRYLQQLHVLVRLRNLGQKLEEVMITVAKFFKEETDPLYRKGQEKGIEKGMEKGIEKGQAKKSYDVVENLILKLGLTNEQAADIAEIPVSFVENVRKELQAKK